MADLSDGFIALPGGMGTLEELCEILTWAQLGLHAKPCGLLNVCDYYEHLKRFFGHMVEERFLKPEYEGLVLADDDPAQLLDMFEQYKPVCLPKWIDRGATEKKTGIIIVSDFKTFVGMDYSGSATPLTRTAGLAQV